MGDPTPFEKISAQSTWYGAKAQRNRSIYTLLKSIQILFSAAIPVVSLATASKCSKWGIAILGASIGVIEGFLQLGQFQQNSLLYRATREALRREEFLHSGKAGPYSGAADAGVLYVERCDAIISGENTKWLASQEQGASKK